MKNSADIMHTSRSLGILSSVKMTSLKTKKGRSHKRSEFFRDFHGRYTGHFTQTVSAHPQDNDVMIKSVGALLVIGKQQRGSM